MFILFNNKFNFLPGYKKKKKVCIGLVYQLGFYDSKGRQQRICLHNKHLNFPARSMAPVPVGELDSGIKTPTSMDP